MIIGVDFDGTCVKHKYPHVGEDIGAQGVLRDLVENGHQLILWTMRSDSELGEAVEWFRKNDIPLFGINENPTQYKWTSSPKPYCHTYIDDAGLGIPLKQDREDIAGRDYVDWQLVRELLISGGFLPENTVT